MKNWLFVLIALFSQPVTANTEIERGAYLLAAGGCVACHTVKNGGDSDFLAGGRALESPFGTFYAPNITPDPQTGIGNWDDEAFIRAFRKGIAPDGSHYYPAFPYTSYTGMTDTDLLDLKAYLMSLPAVRRENREHELTWYASYRFPLVFWKWLYLEPGPFQPTPGQDEEWNRGAYLVRHLGHCGECHTPRNRFGALDQDRELAGSPGDGKGEGAPNITPDRDGGIGKWSESSLNDLLSIGMYPDGDFVGGSMSEVVDLNTSKLSASDRRAMIQYLRALTPQLSAGD